MKRTFLLLGCLGLTAACGGSAPPPAQPVAAPAASDHYSGHWRGLADITSSLPNAPSQMDVTVTIVNGAQCGSFEYGAIACSGNWTCGSSFGAEVMEITETVRYGNERCPSGARVQLRRTDDPNQLLFIYQNTGISATGTLSRGDM